MKRKLINLMLSGIAFILVSCAGTKGWIPNIISSPQRILPAKLTAYTHTESDHRKYKKQTATGSTLRQGVIATDWSIFPVGSILEIQGHNYVVEDYGSALVKPIGTKPVIDIYKPSKASMRKFGAQQSEIKVVQWGSLEESAKILKDRIKFKHCREMYNRIQEKI